MGWFRRRRPPPVVKQYDVLEDARLVLARVEWEHSCAEGFTNMDFDTWRCVRVLDLPAASTGGES